MGLPMEGREGACCLPFSTLLCSHRVHISFLFSFPFPHLPEEGTQQFLRLLFLHGFLIKMMNELRIDKKRQMAFGLCIFLAKCIFHCRS